MMHTTLDQRRDRGIAMLVVVFALMLLSVVGLGMMYGTNMESAINANYRDKQVATYGALGGLQEARDRVQPANPNIIAPTVVPSTTAPAGVIYIINPKGGETVAPWDYNNKYADTELCHEGILGLTSVTGPCTGSSSLPTGSNWYTVKNDSLSSFSPWNAPGLDFKWVRIQLKKANNTPGIEATGSTSDSNQVCWDGRYQVMLPNGYGPECVRIGSVVAVKVTDSGNNYTSPPTVTIAAPPSGVPAAAVANMVATTISSVQTVTINAGGSGYTSPPTVTFVPVDGNGLGATADATIVGSGQSVSSVSLTNSPTACYGVAPAVTFSGGGGFGAAATATLSGTNSCIASWTVTGKCNAHKGETVSSIGLSGGGGSGFSGTLTFDMSGNSTSISVQNPGQNYTSAPTNITNLSGCGSLTFIPLLGKTVSSISLTAGGSGYSAPPTVSLTPGTGTTATQPTSNANLGGVPANAGQIITITVTNGGSGYTAAPTVVLTGGGGSGATATATLGPGGSLYKVDSISVTNPGYGYTSDPAVTISGGGGSGATATSSLGGGASYGKIYLVTALGYTKSGARSMLQAEMASTVTGVGGMTALLVDGPNPDIDAMPNSTNFYINGSDANTCGQAPDPVHPAVGGYDDPNASPATNSVGTIVSSVPRPDHYIGEGPTPSIVNVYGNLGETLGTTSGLRSYIDVVASKAVNVGNNIVLGSAGSPKINYVEGDATLNGNGSGYGLLVVTGKLTMSGNFSWHGAILVVGNGYMDFSGGGTGTIYGTVIVAKIWDNYTTKNMLSEMGSPTVHWNGGGNNGIYYDHCWATNMMAMAGYIPPPSTTPLRVLSMRSLPY